MATPTGTLAMEVMERLRRDIEKSFFFDTLITTATLPPPTPLTREVIHGWIKDVGRLAHERIEPMLFTILDKQQQARTPITGWYHMRADKQRTKTRKQGRKCSRRKWKSMNRRQWRALPIYEEPKDVLVINGRSIVTPRQYQALKDVTIQLNSTG